MDGVWVEGVASGRLALVLQHEVDHLNGVLMTDVGIETPTSGAYMRLDSLGAIQSTDHWELMNDPDYNMRTAMFNGASLVEESELH